LSEKARQICRHDVIQRRWRVRKHCQQCAQLKVGGERPLLRLVTRLAVVLPPAG